jgi:glycosyltransferase involved in cell wall biosynthesis
MTARAQRTGRVLYVQYTNPGAYPPIDHGAHLLAAAGFEVLLLGTDILGDVLTVKAHPGIRVKLRAFRAAGVGQKWHYFTFLLWSLAETIRWRPDWIYASDPLSSPIALVLHLATGARVVYHEHDAPAASTSPFMRIVLAARRRLARRAALCVLPNRQRAEAFGRETGRADAVIVWNCPVRAEVAPPRPVDAESRVRVLYAGSVVPNRLPATVVRALALLPAEVSLTVVGYETAGHPGYIATLQEAARQVGVEGRFVSLGPLSREGLMRTCAAYDVGLALFPLSTGDPNENTMVGASNKVFDYLAGGLAVLVADRPEWRRAVVDAGYGLECDPGSEASIAAALRWWLDHRAERSAMGERGRQRILHDWNYEEAFRPVLDCIQGPMPGRAEADYSTAASR